MKELKIKNSNLLILIDDTDFDKLSKFEWRLTANGYAVRVGDTYVRETFSLRHYRDVFLHFDLLGIKMVDHIDKNKLNCQRSNLRPSSFAFNSANRKTYKKSKGRFKGVYLYGVRWVARITFNKKTIELGSFKDEILAAIAYDDKALELFGEHACLNFPLYGI